MRDSKGRFIKGYGFWRDKKRPGLKTSTTFKKGQIPWNKGIDNRPICRDCDKKIDYRSTYCNKHSQIGLKSSKWQGGRPICIKCNKIINYYREFCRNCYKKENHHWWKGGITKENILIRTSKVYKLWRLSVFKRDNHTCQICGIRGGLLHADHIKPFALFPELRLDLDNGRTVHAECHKTTKSYLNNKITRGMYL